MDSRFNKNLLVILSLSSLLLSSNAVPSTRVIDFDATNFPAAAPKSSVIDFISTSLRPTAAPSSRDIDFISTSIPDAAPKSSVVDFTSTSIPSSAPSSRYMDFISTSFPAVDASKSDISVLKTQTANVATKAASNSDISVLKTQTANVATKVASNSDISVLKTQTANVATKADPEISKICIDGENPTLCAETISKFMKGPFDALKALEIEVDTTFGQAKTVAGTITKLLKDPSTDKKTIDALGICQSQYEDMLDAIKESEELLKQQNVVDAYYKFTAVISYQSACQDAFAESPGIEMPFTKDSQTLFQLGGNSLGIMNDLVNNHKI